MLLPDAYARDLHIDAHKVLPSEVAAFDPGLAAALGFALAVICFSTSVAADHTLARRSMPSPDVRADAGASPGPTVSPPDAGSRTGPFPARRC